MKQRKWETHSGLLHVTLEDATTEVQDLIEELQSWHDGMDGTNLEYSQKYSDLEEAIDELERVASTLQDIDLPENSDGLEAQWNEPKVGKRGYSRSVRAGNIGSMLEAIADALEEEGDSQEYQDARSELLDASSDLGNVMFPGMYG